MSLDFYNEHGEAAAYTDDGTHIYSWAGKPLAYLSGGHVYSFEGQFKAWFEDGWIRDKDGSAMLFTPISKGGPMKPFLQFQNFEGFKEFLPFKGFQELVPFKPFYTLNWSKDSLG